MLPVYQLPRVVYKFDRDGSYSRSTDRRISSRYCFHPRSCSVSPGPCVLNYRWHQEGSKCQERVKNLNLSNVSSAGNLPFQIPIRYFSRESDLFEYISQLFTFQINNGFDYLIVSFQILYKFEREVKSLNLWNYRRLNKIFKRFFKQNYIALISSSHSNLFHFFSQIVLEIDFHFSMTNFSYFAIDKLSRVSSKRGCHLKSDETRLISRFRAELRSPDKF